MPNHFRYSTVTQKPYCSVPACVQMVLNRRGIKGYSQEDIGFELGLTIPSKDSGRLRKAFVSETPPKTGYGTRIGEDKYSMNNFFRKRRISLISDYFSLESLEDPADFISQMLENQKDVMALYDIGIVKGNGKHDNHASLVEIFEGEIFVLVDTGKIRNKRRFIKKSVLLEAMKSHGKEKGAGFYIFSEYEWDFFDDAARAFSEIWSSVKSLGKRPANGKGD